MGGGGVGQELEVDIVGRWGRVAPQKGKLFDLKKDGGECPELVLSSQVIPNSYWIFLSLEALASEAAPRVESESRTAYRVALRAYEILRPLKLCRRGYDRGSCVTRGSTYDTVIEEMCDRVDER